MDPRTSVSPSGIEAALRDLKPVAVTRWSARLVDPQCERDYRVQRFADDRRRLMLLMALAAAAAVLIFLGRLYEYWYYGRAPEPLYPPLVSIFMPFCGVAIFRRLKTPQSLEIAVLAVGSVGCSIRLLLLTLQPNLLAMWLPLMVTMLFVIYLYLPIRFTASVAFAGAFSLVTPFWWAWLAHPVLPGPEIYRGLLWMLLANALGFTAANALQRSQRIQFAQSLLLRKLLSTDSLTGIANRRRFDEALDREWRRCQRAGMPLSLLMIDVDHFKPYNDHLGHQQGDECLRQVARLLVDGTGRPGDLVARYGGEEFLCLLPDTGMAGALAVANRLSAAMRQADIHHPRSPAGARLTISIGAATAKDLSGAPNALMAFVDKLLYAAKAAGRNQVKVGTPPVSRVAAREAA
jgi:diguanylate cyclase (GGDEF)-like protein